MPSTTALEFLACTVRGCRAPLLRAEQSWQCRNGHSFDIAKSGYVNLLQPQDRKSSRAGDPRPALEARARLLDAGIGRDLLTTFIDRAATLELPAVGAVVDLGCGGGDLLAGLTERRPLAAAGIDLSVSAIDRAARRYSRLTWLVANADRRLPIQDASVDLLTAYNGRRNPGDAARVVKPGGYALLAVPAEDDLIELRASIQGEGIARDRVETLVAEYDGEFEILERASAREQHHLPAEALQDLLTATYRGARTSAGAKRDTLTTMTVTLGTEVVLCRRRPAPPGRSGRPG
jgi:23S rRNA (guanine745-N1)-methyltransferase